MSMLAGKGIKKILRWPQTTAETSPENIAENSRPAQLMTAAAVTMLVSLCYVLLGYQQWHSFRSPSWDLGIFTQLAKAYASFQAPIVPIKGDNFNLLGDHFHPLLALLGPVYLLFPSAFTLLVVQAVCFGLSAGIFTLTTYQVAEKSLALPKRLPLVAAFFMGIAFGLSWGLQTAAASQFHEIAFAVPLWTLSLHYYVLKNYTAAVFWAAPLVFVKEDLGLSLLIYGIIIFMRSRSGNIGTAPPRTRHAFRSYAGLWLSAWGTLWFALSSFVILPLLNVNSEYAYTKKSGIAELLADPWRTIGGIFSNSDKMWTVFLLIAVSSGAALFSSLSLIMIPTLTWRFLSPERYYWSPDWHYSAILMPLAMSALLDVIVRLCDKPATPGSRRVSQRITGKKPSRYLCCSMLSLTLVTTVFSFFSFPLKNIIHPQNYHADARQQAARRALEAIPANSKVETDVALMSYLVDDHARQTSGASPINTVYWTGNQNNPVPDYLVIDARFWTRRQTAREDVSHYAMKLHPGTRYRTIFNQEGYQIAARIP